MTVTRFAPSPNGSLHLGHAFSAITAYDLAQSRDGKFLLRIEDIDGARSRSALAQEFREDLAWLGLEWEEVPPQSARLASYAEAAERLRAMELLYPCQCSRSDILAAKPRMGPEGPIYPGTCKGRAIDDGVQVSWRLDVAAALARTGTLEWQDDLAGRQVAQPQLLGDVVLMRRDEPASYHLAATMDDAVDGVTLVTRGADLFAASHIHRLLQALLGLPEPVYHHHRLVLGDDGRKLSKSRGDVSLRALREAGETAESIRARLGFSPGPHETSRGRPARS